MSPTAMLLTGIKAHDAATQEKTLNDAENRQKRKWRLTALLTFHGKNHQFGTFLDL